MEDIESSSSLGKRKTEDCESEEDEETESSIETEEEESEPETEPVWGYDSFEDRDYYSYSEGELAEAFSDPESVKPALDYRRQIYLTSVYIYFDIFLEIRKIWLILIPTQLSSDSWFTDIKV